MIDKTTYIERLSLNENEFDTLKKKGIELIQELSGKNWTDYNLHDPGVTILEQLCYGLTEISYLTDFDVKDILTSEDGEIHLKDLALYKPLEIFPSEIITHSDYCKALFNNIDGLRNVWIEDNEDCEKKGLYRFVLDITMAYMDRRELVVDRVKRFYNANRNLCEDIESIVFYQRKPVEVAGVIEINKERTPDEVMAHVFFECFKLISPRIAFHSYRNMIHSDMELEHVLTGPELSKGYIKEEDLLAPSKSLVVSLLMQKISVIKGVESIADFHLEVEDRIVRAEYQFADTKTGGYLKIPTNSKNLKIVLVCSNRPCTINLQEVLRIFDQLHNQYKSSFNTSKEIANICQTTTGRYVKFDEYFSIQNHFPDIYGINQYGIPHTAKPERKAKAKQLKAYLLLCEQIVANFLSQLENVKDLFSVKDSIDSTYYTQTLKSVPHSSELMDDDLQSNEELQNKKLKEILSNYDDAYDRRSRLVNYILAMYGEHFEQKSFQQFNYYYSKEELKQVLYKNKVFWLKHITDLNRYKARSFNYQSSYQLPDNVAMIKLKSSLLLGIKDAKQMKYSSVLEHAQLQLSIRTFNEDCALFEREHQENKLDTEYLDRNFSRIEAAGVHCNQMEFREVREQLHYIGNGEICEEFFRYGINLNQYRIGKLKGHKYYTLAFKSVKSGRYLYLRKCKEEQKGIVLANSLQQHLIKFNQQCEGMHVVEHILLRPENGECEYPDELEDFYPFRISVILPNWSARFNSSRFKDYLQETLQTNLPVHVYPEFYWLNSSELKIFEDLYHKWLDFKKNKDTEMIDSYSRQIIQFLRDNKQVKTENNA